MKGWAPPYDGPALYFVSAFGNPSAEDSWGWRFEGHHLPLNSTVVDGAMVVWAPAFLGANPAGVREGSRGAPHPH